MSEDFQKDEFSQRDEVEVHEVDLDRFDENGRQLLYHVFVFRANYVLKEPTYAKDVERRACA